jgi:hypothetical protein
MYAHQFIHDNTNLALGARTDNWIYDTLGEIKRFVAILLNMNIIRHPTVVSCTLATHSDHLPWLSSMLCHKRFQLILKCFQLVCNRNLSGPGDFAYDPCLK